MTDTQLSAQDAVEDARLTALLDRMEKALVACQQYDHWAREIVRLTHEIAAVHCPREEGVEIRPGYFQQSAPSHFREAAEESLPVSAWSDEPETRRRNLPGIAVVVADCPACSRLCELIVERKEARVRYGVAKREVRRIGRMTARQTTSQERT
jgi:hypothetical protein